MISVSASFVSSPVEGPFDLEGDRSLLPCRGALSQGRPLIRLRGMRTPIDAVAGESQRSSEFRPIMFSIAYRVVGQVNDAEDIVQEAFILAGAQATEVDVQGSRRL